MFLLFLPMATKHRTFQMQPSLEPSIGLQAKMFPHGPPRATNLGTFHWPPSCGLPSPPSFLFSLKAQIWIIYLSFFSDTIFDLNI
jgi:hypothetical protein